MSISIAELLRAPTRDEVNEKFLTILETIGVPARSWRKAGVWRTIVRGAANIYADAALLLTAFNGAKFLETATGDWLTVLARNDFGVERTPASFATGQLTLVNLGGVYTVAASALRAVNPTTGKLYTNVSPFALSPNQTLTIDIEAIELGAASSTAPETITQLETVLRGVTVTNAAAVAGNDPETDDDLRQHCRAKLGALSVRGPRTAYEYAVDVATRADGSPVNVNRKSISRSSSTGTVTIYVASASGTPDSVDLAGVTASVEANARPDCVTVSVLTATAVPVARTLTVFVRNVPGISAAAILTAINAALITAIAGYDIGGLPTPPSTQGYLYGDYISGVIKSADPTIYHVTGLGADTALNEGQVATLSTTISIRIVDQ